MKKESIETMEAGDKLTPEQVEKLEQKMVEAEKLLESFNRNAPIIKKAFNKAIGKLVVIVVLLGFAIFEIFILSKLF